MKGGFWLIIILLLLSINLVSAKVDWTIPTEANLNSNFQIKIFGTAMYGLEIELPDNFEIVLDRSNGKVVDGIYRTFYTSNLDITLRSTTIGDFDLTGQYTQGEGVKSLDTANIKITTILALDVACPECPLNEEWSECLLTKQKRNTYTCSEMTNFTCKSVEAIRPCEDDITNGTDTNVDTTIADKKSFIEKIGNTLSRIGTSLGDFFKFILDKIIFWS